MSDPTATPDHELLRQFTRDHSQAAFTELVKRHVNLVYSAALRQVRSPQLAEEVTQSAFADLARDAVKLKPDTIVTAWLYSVARRTAIDVVRKESRRQLREQIAVETNAMNATEASWTEIEPLLDEAVAALDETDRAAVLLRYFENQSLRAVGQQLGVSDDAAQKRVMRAVEQLREFFAKRGVSVGAGGLVVVISSNAVQAAPVGLAVSISAAALAGTAATTSTLIAATTKTIAMTTLQKTLVTATVAVLAGAGIYEARQAAQLRDQVQTLQQQQAPLAEQIQQLQNNFNNASNRLETLLAENSRLKSNPNQTEVLKLRGDVSRLRSDAARLAQTLSEKSSTNDSSPASELKDKLQQMPERYIPELQLVGEDKWAEDARRKPLKTEDDVRQALGNLRRAARIRFGAQLEKALGDYLETSHGQLPKNVSELQNYFHPPADNSILNRYEMARTGSVGSLQPGEILIQEKSAVDDQYDTLLSVTSAGYVIQGVGKWADQR